MYVSVVHGIGRSSHLKYTSNAIERAHAVSPELQQTLDKAIKYSITSTCSSEWLSFFIVQNVQGYQKAWGWKPRVSLYTVENVSLWS